MRQVGSGSQEISPGHADFVFSEENVLLVLKRKLPLEFLNKTAPAQMLIRRGLPAVFVHQPGGQRVRVILPPQAAFPSGRLDLDDPLKALENRHIKGAAAKVEDEHGAEV